MNIHKVMVILAMVFTAIPTIAQTDLIFPWVTNNATFRGKIIINNLNGSQVTATLVAQRAATSTDEPTETIQVTLEPYSQMVAQAGDLFTTMGDGSAYMVRLTADVSNITGALVNVSTLSSSGSSPSQANTLKASDASSTWLYDYMFIGGGFAACVLINLGDETANATLYAYQGGQRVAEKEISVNPGHPWGDTAQNIFPNLTGDLFIVAHSEGASLLASAFVFNELEFLEPAMANATPISSVPDPDQGGGVTVSFATQIQPIFTASCGGDGSFCHLNGGSQKSLRLDEGSAYNEIVNVNSTVVTSEVLIIPGDADNSYLFRKIQPAGNGVFYAGDRMPDPDGPTPFLSDSEIQLIRDWITQGALNN